MKRTTRSLGMLLLAAAWATPRDATGQGAESSFPFEPLHASAVAVGGAGVALRGAQFALLNPAAFADGRGAELSHWALPIGAQDYSLSLSHGGRWGTIRLAARRRDWGEIAGDLGLSDLTAGEQSITVGFARTALHERLAWGLSVARLDADYVGARTHAWAIDLGAGAVLGRGFLFGVSLLHLGHGFESNGTPTRLPARIRPGVAWEGRMAGLHASAAADLPVSLALDSPPDVHAGFELGRTGGSVNAFIRAGFSSLVDRDGGTSRRNRGSVGGGLRVSHVIVDIAYMLGGVFGPERFISLSIEW